MTRELETQVEDEEQSEERETSTDSIKIDASRGYKSKFWKGNKKKPST